MTPKPINKITISLLNEGINYYFFNPQHFFFFVDCHSKIVKLKVETGKVQLVYETNNNNNKMRRTV